MNKIKFRDDIDQIIDDINSSLKAPVIARSSIESQWKRGNGSVVRIDTALLRNSFSKPSSPT
ncbi:hypothetical protein NMR59_003574 [Vibrio cholerae]|nr:hypothetical protein [Vibrio cholerae]